MPPWYSAGIVYITLPLSTIPKESVSSESLVRPYLDALLSLSADSPHTPTTPLFTTFYLETLPTALSSVTTTPSNTNRSYIVPPALSVAPLPDIPDEATVIAENTFKEAVKCLRSKSKPNCEEDAEVRFWPPIPADDEEDDDAW